jgi:hypothetical protein
MAGTLIFLFLRAQTGVTIPFKLTSIFPLSAIRVTFMSMNSSIKYRSIGWLNLKMNLTKKKLVRLKSITSKPLYAGGLGYVSIPDLRGHVDYEILSRLSGAR